MAVRRNLFGILSFVIGAVVFFLILSPNAFALETMRKADFDCDGSKEANVYYQGNEITKVVMDKNNDGKADAMVYYRDGFRDYAELDSNFDGIIETIILYYFTGIPASIMVDRNGDNKPDRWTYFENGIIYKREWDRNFDGIPDYCILFFTKADNRLNARAILQTLTKKYDNDYDGVFEKVVKTRRRTRAKRLSNTVGSLYEVKV